LIIHPPEQFPTESTLETETHVPRRFSHPRPSNPSPTSETPHP
jgi:hypothetical protein